MGSGALIKVPLYTLVEYMGMGDAPSALQRAGLGPALGNLITERDVILPRLMKDFTEGKVKNLTHFRNATTQIYGAAKSVQAEPAFVIGGECSIAVGILAGLAEVFGGKPGMLWMDAHGDFNTPETSPSGYIGGMCLAMACGRGPVLGLGSGGNRPLLEEERLVHVGSRALDPPEAAVLNTSPARLFTTQEVRKKGAAEVARQAARLLEDRTDWIMCHLDLDVIDPRVIPAVNYPTPGGLTLAEAATMIRTLMGTKKAKVLEITSYNPSNDKDGSSARRIIDLVKAVIR
ncbi:MAG TPA: arginase family protein [Nitrososphaerales archaeon]|nr:arginase family protein [Nitrososphaerales archaeon]